MYLNPGDDARGAVKSGYRRLRTMKSASVERAVRMIPNGASLMVGGFIGVGTPDRLIDELVRQQKRILTVIPNETASPRRGIGKPISAKLMSRTIASHISPPFA
jgi:acetate CoA/acetoacetate CoA-transferase alpha subunit